MMRKSGVRKWAIRIAICIAVCLPAALAVLLLLRGSGSRVVNMARDAHFPCATYEPSVRFARIPGCKGRGYVGSHEAEFSYNSLGLRDKDYPSYPAPGVTRILMLDGSVLSGSGLEEPVSPVRLIEKELRAAGASSVEVINGAVEGFSTVENAIKFEKFVNAYHPQVVILYSISQFKMFNDLVMNEYLIRNENGDPVRLWSPRSLISSFFQVRSRPLLRVVVNTFEFYERAKVSWRLSQLQGRERSDRFQSATLDVLEWMRNRAKGAGVKFFVLWDGMDANSDIFLQQVHSEVLFRLLGPFVPKVSVEAAELERELQRRGIDTLSIAAEYKATFHDGYYLPGDHHWNELGAATFAKMSARRIIERLPRLVTGKSGRRKVSGSAP